MRTDVTQIRFDVKYRTVRVPEDVWSEICGFCRIHGETDLPAFPQYEAPSEVGFSSVSAQEGGFVELDELPTSASIWGYIPKHTDS